MTLPTMFFWLLVGHSLCDYPLQGDFLASAKNPHTGVPGINPIVPMLAHCFIHAGAVALITGSVPLGLLELVAHFVIDCGKCEGKITFVQDQAIHVTCKILWVAL